jgi:hypothetical protein
MLKSELIDDTILAITQSAPSDDTEIEKEQIAYHASSILHSLIKNECDAEIRAGRSIPPIYISFQDCEDIEEEDSDCQSDCVDRLYIELTDEVIDLRNDEGLVRVITDEGDQVKKVSIGMLSTLKKLRFSKPSMENPLCYRQGTKIYIEGIKKPEIPFNFLTVFYVKKQDIQSLADTDEVIVSDLIRPILISQLAEKLKTQMYGTQPDQQSDGTDVKALQYHRAISNASLPTQPEE